MQVNTELARFSDGMRFAWAFKAYFSVGMDNCICQPWIYDSMISSSTNDLNLDSSPEEVGHN